MFSFRRNFFSSNTNDISRELEQNLKEIKDLGKVPTDLDLHRACAIPKDNIIITLNDSSLITWDIKTLKKQAGYPVPRLVFSSQNLTFITELKLLLVTFKSNESSIFSLRGKPRLLCKSPVALPYTEYINPLNIVISFGKDLLSIWGIFNKQVYCTIKGSFHTIKFLKGLNKIAAFEGLFCELYVYDIDPEKKTLRNRKQLYSNDNSFGCINQIEWLENRNLLLVTDSVIGMVKMFSCKNEQWQEIRTIEKEGFLSHALRLNSELVFLSWTNRGKIESFLFEHRKNKVQSLKAKIQKIHFYSPEKKIFASNKDDGLVLWGF